MEQPSERRLRQRLRRTPHHHEQHSFTRFFSHGLHAQRHTRTVRLCGMCHATSPDRCGVVRSTVEVEGR